MKYIIYLILVGLLAIVMMAVNVPDRWLYPVCLGAFISLAWVFHGSEAE